MFPRPFPLLLAVLAAWTPAQGPGLANHRPRLPAGLGSAVGCAVADLNGDKLQDMVRATSADFAVLLQEQSGRFKTALVQKAIPQPGTTSRIVSLVVGRPRSKVPDVIVGYQNGLIQLYPNDGKGGLGKAITLPPITGGFSFALVDLLVGDLDGNGLDDLVVILNQEEPRVFFSFGASYKQAVLVGPKLRTPRAALADLNLDGRLDLVVVTGDPSLPAAPAVFLNSRSSGLRLSALAFPLGYRVAASRVLAANVMSMGRARPQLIFARSSKMPVPLEVYRNMSATGLSYVRHANSGGFALTGPRDLDAVDVNQDGYLDVVAIQSDGAVLLGANLGAMSPGAFSKAETLLVAAPRSCLVASDLERDGDVDLVVSGAGIEDSCLLADKAGTLPFYEDTESQGILLLGNRTRAHGALLDVTGDEDLDIALYDYMGRPTLLENVSGQGRFSLANSSVSTALPKLPMGMYRDLQRASVATQKFEDLLVLGSISSMNSHGMRVLVRTASLPGKVTMRDETALRWRAKSDFLAFAVADLSGRAVGSSGAMGYSDVVGLDKTGQLGLVVNQKGLFVPAKSLVATGIQMGSRILVADLNLDKLNDIVVIQPTYGIRVFLARAGLGDTFLALPALKIPGSVGLLADLSGDVLPDLLLATPLATPRLRLLRGNGLGSFVDATAYHLPKLGATGPSGISSMALLGVDDSHRQSILLGITTGPDLIMAQQAATLPQGPTYGAPEHLSTRGSMVTTQLLVGDLDTDGDDDLVSLRSNTLPSVLLGQATQLTGVGITQAGRHALLRVRFPNANTGGLVVIGMPVTRTWIPGLGIARVGTILGQLPALMPRPDLTYELSLPVPATFPAQSLPLQLISVNLKTNVLRFCNLDILRTTQR